MRNAETNIKNKIISRYLEKDQVKTQTKSSDINVLLNRIELNKKSESRKKLYFSAAASTGLILFGLMIF
ncbi:hypothetical protein [Candidatus Pelagibacter sp. HIMB1483]|jgi:hypothetical protein|uniref:hypothetical protein n=1 Tax=Candidatus Pelagibacter sp. HIMB1483 TaxID=3415414 RepID=UPI003F868916|tara:strand:- start:882 stop:1088 length:207 start_codon:yes stop_codon:yes gene_type:complete